MAHYPNLPGTTVEVQDGQMNLSPEDSSSRVLIIGDVIDSVDAPNEPIRVRDEYDIKENFGGFIINGRPNPIAVEWASVTKEADVNTYLLALEGKTEKEKFVNLHEALFTYLNDFEADHVVLTGLFADQEIDSVEAEDFTDEEIQEAFPNIPGIITESEGTPDSEDYVELYYANPAMLVADYAQRQSLQSNETIAYIGVKPLEDTSMKSVSKYVKKLVSLDNEFSKYLQVVVGPETGVNVEGSYKMQWATGIGAYCALVSKLEPQNAPTNQAFSRVTSLRYLFSLKQLNDLVGNKYVTLTIRNQQVIAVDGVTTAPDIIVGGEKHKSDFTRLSTLRITNYMVQAVRNVTEPFIGNPSGWPLYTSMTAAIKSEITGAIDAGIIQDARFSISMKDSFDSAIIRMTILPQFEMRKIRISIGLNDPITYGVDSENENP